MRFYLIVAALLFSFSIAAHAEYISETDLRAHIEILASDDFGGRKPGTEGENKTLKYIATQWQQAGLVPATGSSSWYAPVALVDRTPLSQTVRFMQFNGKRAKSIRIDDDQLILRSAMPSGQLTNIPVVHVGYGNQSDDILAEAVSDKMAFMFTRSPLGVKDFPSYRERRAKILSAGATGVLTIAGSDARYIRLARRFRGANTNLDAEGYHADIEGVISKEAAEKILRKADIDYEQLAKDAASSDFRPLETGVFADISVDTRVRSYQSHNVIGKIPGRKPRSGAVLFMGHWDHLGECRREPAVDRICNGAVDNASGISLLIEIAERLVKERPDRDVYFLATTAEESGLLGAKAFAADPSFPLEDLVAVFNADTVALTPDGKLLAVVGRGKTKLDEDLEKIAAAEDREIDKTDKANAFIKRQDAYVFLEKGIPAFMITSAFSDEERLNSYLESRYHDASDELDEQLLLGGAADDANFHVALGRYFGSVASYPIKTGQNSAVNSAGE
jgi:Peptidase family M28